MRKDALWTKDFCRVTAATALGAAGGILSSFALSFLVFDETGSTLAAAVIVAIQLFPYVILPLFLAPLMDRLPRKPFLVGGDIVNGLLYGLAGLYLLRCEFSYGAYLGFSLLLACLGSFDELAYESFYPLVLPKGQEEKGYTVSSMLYPVLKVLMMPLAALLFERLGVAVSLKTWWGDIREAAEFLKGERGLRALYDYMAVTNGVAAGYAPLLVAFFRTAPGFTAGMYSLFSVAEFLGRTVGGAVRYRWRLKPDKRFSFTFFVYQLYESMDACLLWLPYPLMLVNRAVCGFLGINSAAIRQAAVQSYLPERFRARVNAYGSVLLTAASSVLSLAMGLLGEALDYRLCVTAGALGTLLFCWGTVFRRRKDVAEVLRCPAETGE